MSKTEATSDQQQLVKIREYYEVATKYYAWIWNWLNSPEAGLHYGIWEKGMHTRYQAIKNENRVLAGLAQIKPGEVVLDVGSGVGGSGVWLAKNCQAQVIEANISLSQLVKGADNAKRAGVSESLHFGEMDYHRLGLADESVDVVWSLESIEHAYDRELFLSECYRVLKPGGRLVVAGTFAGDTKPDKEQQRQLNVGFKAAGAFSDFGSAGELTLTMDEAGFKKIENQDITGKVEKSAREMELMCAATLWGAKLGNKLGLVSQSMMLNNEWGTYQSRLFQDKVTSYNVLLGRK